ncbi:MAG: carbohydrate ABC transporter permease, partial [Chloroflexota bacterium]
MSVAGRVSAQPVTNVRAQERLRVRRLLGRGALYVLAICIAALFTGPFLWTVGSSLKSSVDIRSFPPTLFPSTLHFENYITVFQVVPFGQFLLNTIKVTALAVTGQTVSATFVAYGFARFRFPFRGFLFALVLATLLLPREVTWIPLFLLYKKLGWLDTLKPLIVPSFFGGGAFFIFLLRQFFRSIPRELSDAAKVDGASEFRIYWQLIMPLSRPAITVVLIFTFLDNWNNFLEPLIILSSPDNFTV